MNKLCWVSSFLSSGQDTYATFLDEEYSQVCHYVRHKLSHQVIRDGAHLVFESH